MAEELSDPVQSSNSKKKWIVLGIIVILALVVLYFILASIFVQFKEVGRFQKSVNGETDTENSGVDVNINADVEAVSDCGDLACFKEKFANCEKSKVTYTLFNNLVYYYEIIGPDGNACGVKSKFIKNPNPSWVGKEMTCNYDNSQDFDKAVKDMDQCQGPLYNLMTDGV